MKPGFALTLSQDGITLLQRAIRGWLIVGEVPLDAPDLKGALARLRQTAEALAPGAVTTKLVLPEDQILYTTVRVPGRSDAQRRAQVAAALDGRTPYALDEIVFDFHGKGDDLQVAAVARETLSEAEHFAAEHGFNPVSFVAAPDPGRFAGEPFFGLATGLPGAKAPGATVERDGERIKVVGHAVLPRSTPEKAQEAGLETTPEIAPATGPDRTTAAKAVPDGLPPAPNPELDPGPPVPLTFSSRRSPAAEAAPATAPDAASDAAQDTAAGGTSRGKPPTLRRPAKTPPSPQRRITPRLPGLGPSAKAAMAPAAQGTPETALSPGHAPGPRPATVPGTPPEAISAPPPRTPPRKAPTAHPGATPAPVATPPSQPPSRGEAEAFARLGPTAARHKTSLMFLAAALIAALAAVAVWSALSLGRKPPPTAPVEAARAPTETAAAPAHSAPAHSALTPAPAPAPGTTAGTSGPGLPAAPARLAALAPPTPAAPSLPGGEESATASTAPAAPQPEAQDSALAVPANPAPYGTTYDLGPDGLVKPTPEGARTPNGTLVIAGRPPVVPPPRPGSATTAPPETTSGAIPLTSLRPTGRPETATAPEPAPEPVTGPVSRQAVAVSPVPHERPADFAQSVAAALAASRAAAPSPAPAPAPAPAAQSVAPRVPTNASVAREATVKNALNLNQLSLLGVFGSASNRKALLRMPGGRIVRVGVGDRVASGKVVAIGEHEVHYVKNGRTLVLSMPKG